MSISQDLTISSKRSAKTFIWQESYRSWCQCEFCDCLSNFSAKQQWPIVVCEIELLLLSFKKGIQLKRKKIDLSHWIRWNICTKWNRKLCTIDINFIGLFEYNFKNISRVLLHLLIKKTLIRSSRWNKKAKMKRKQNFCSLLIISNRKSFDYSISSKIKLPDEKFFCFSSSFNRVLNTWIHE